jgi:hypothetical protein
MKYFFSTRLGSTRYELADGSLLCKDVPIARAGWQVYGAEELEGENLEPDSDGEISVYRSPEEVFRPETIASFEGMTFTVLHPEEMVNPSNWRENAHGHATNIRRGTGEQSDLLLADLIVKSSEAIAAIYAGVEQISCGYDAEYRPTSKGKAEQYDIIGNHIALVPNGRAGIRCSIGDSDMAGKTAKKGWFDALKRAIKTKDTAAIEEVMGNAPSDLTNDEDAGGGSLPSAINITVAPQYPLPDKEPEMAGITTDNAEAVPAWAQAIIARLDKLEGGTATIDSGENEEDKEEAKKATTDAAYHQDIISRAEILVPGVKMPEGGKLATFKRSVLDAAYRTPKGMQILAPLVGASPDFKTMPKATLDATFTAASEIAKLQNKPVFAFGVPTKDGAKDSPQALNEAFANYWNKKG